MPTSIALRRAIGRSIGTLDTLLPRRRGITVLAYHRVGAITPISVDLPRAQVVEQLDWLVASADVISIDQAATRLVAPDLAPATRPPVVLTADDGTADWIDVLLPLLVDRGLPMTWYVATKFVDEHVEFPNAGAPISWAGLADAVATGLVTVASHTHSHAVMSGLDATEAAAELDRSTSLIQDHLGVECRHFAYPKAIAPSAAADREVRRRFRTASLAGNRVNVPSRTDLARLGRTPIQRGDDADAFAHKVHGGARAQGWARERLDQRRHRHAMY